MNLFTATLSFWSLVPAFLAGLIAFYFVTYVSWATGAWYVAIPAGVVFFSCAIGLAFVLLVTILFPLIAIGSMIGRARKRRRDG